MKSGIYKITNTITNDFYIGSSIDIKKRFYNHKRCLKENKHRNKHLQNSWNKYKEENFVFEVIVFCQKNYLIELEQFFIDKYQPVYNICLIVDSPRIGTNHSNETKNLISNKLSKKVKQFDLNGNFIKEWESCYEASKSLNINDGNISSCCNYFYKSAGGFIWKFSNDTNKIIPVIDNKIKKVSYFDSNWNKIGEFPSVTEAAKILKVNKSNISFANKNKSKCKSYYIQY